MGRISFDMTLNTAVLRFNDYFAEYFNAAHKNKVFLKKNYDCLQECFGRIHVYFLNRNLLGFNWFIISLYLRADGWIWTHCFSYCLETTARSKGDRGEMTGRRKKPSPQDYQQLVSTRDISAGLDAFISYQQVWALFTNLSLFKPVDLKLTRLQLTFM